MNTGRDNFKLFVRICKRSEKKSLMHAHAPHSKQMYQATRFFFISYQLKIEK